MTQRSREGEPTDIGGVFPVKLGYGQRLRAQASELGLLVGECISSLLPGEVYLSIEGDGGKQTLRSGELPYVVIGSPPDIAAARERFPRSDRVDRRVQK